MTPDDVDTIKALREEVRRLEGALEAIRIITSERLTKTIGPSEAGMLLAIKDIVGGQLDMVTMVEADHE